MTFVVLFVVLPLVGGSAWAWSLKRQFDEIGTIATASLSDRPDADDGRDLTILLIGSDKGETTGDAKATTIAEDAASGSWPAGKYRSDTLMVVHIPADRSQVYVVSIPRDSFVPIHDAAGQSSHSEKINAAFSEHGPLGTIATVENLTGLRMDHLAIIDWDGFKDLSTAVGGVPVTIPRSFYDPQQKVQWEAGEHVLKGKKALQYVRTRYGLVGGDFDRIKRQQNFMRALMEKVMDEGISANPLKLNRTIGAVTKNLTVDEGWSTQSIGSLALSLRGISTSDVVFLTAPVAGTETIPVWGSIARLDEAKSTELFTAIKDGTMDEYLAAYPDDLLPDADEVS